MQKGGVLRRVTRKRPDSLRRHCRVESFEEQQVVDSLMASGLNEETLVQENIRRSVSVKVTE